MSYRLGETLRLLCLIAVSATATIAGGLSLASWRGLVRDDAGKPVGTATVKLRSVSGERHYAASSSADGAFVFPEVIAGEYELAVESGGKSWGAAKPVVVLFKDGAALTNGLQLSLSGVVRLLPGAEAISVQGS